MAKVLITSLFCIAISIMSIASLHAVTDGDLPHLINGEDSQTIIIVPILAEANSVFEPFLVASNDDIREQIRAKLKTMSREQILANEQSPWMLGCRTSCACKYMEWDNTRCEGMSVETPSEEEFKQCNLRCEAYIYLRP